MKKLPFMITVDQGPEKTEDKIKYHFKARKEDSEKIEDTRMIGAAV
ncbi:MAG: hypothetical protein V2I56_22325 [Desulfobacteraceae bacterium]|jgi:hypothetical protein|nr:hypothetical protein [Desulfobacteraceae bacterium]